MRRAIITVSSCLVLLTQAFPECIIGKPLMVHQICGETWPGSKLRLTKAQESAPTIQQVIVDEHGQYVFDKVPSGDYWLYDAPVGDREAVPVAFNVRRPLQVNSCKQPIELEIHSLPETCVSPKLIASGRAIMTTPLPVTECPTEVVAPNLVLAYSTHVVGSLKDQTTAPLSKSKVVLRRYKAPSNTVDLKTVTTDENGRFDLGTLAPGKYRVLASPHRGFAQPEMLECMAQTECRMEITLEANPTDLPYAACPVK